MTWIITATEHVLTGMALGVGIMSGLWVWQRITGQPVYDSVSRWLDGA